MKGNPVLYKTLVVGVIVLFIGVGVQPAIATVQPETEIDIEPKDYLFQTIIDIANNPDVKNLLEQYTPDLFKFDIDRSIYRKIFFRNPRLLFDTLFTKPSMTVEYLNKCYNNGIDITSILGEDKVIETIENIEVTDTKLFDELNNMISKDEALSERLATLNGMNKDLNYYSPSSINDIVCFIAFIILIPSLFLFSIGYYISEFLEVNPIIWNIIGWFFYVPSVLSITLLCVLFEYECLFD